MKTPRIIQLIFLKETFIILFSLVLLWFGISLWSDSSYTVKDLKPHAGTITGIDSVITQVKDKPLFKEITKELQVTLDSEPDKVFTLLTTENFGWISSIITIGDPVILYTKPRLWGIFGLKKASAINHLTKDDIVVLDYMEEKSKISGFTFPCLALSLIALLYGISKLRKRLWWDFGGYTRSKSAGI